MSTTKTEIAWTNRTWNPVRGCSRVSPGCDNCYAMKVAYRFKGPGLAYEGLATLRNGKADWTGIVRTVPDALDEPLHWRKPARIFVNSQSDLFHHGFSNEYIAAVFGVMAACPQHTFQILTKRAERMGEWFGWAAKKGAECGSTAVGLCATFASQRLGRSYTTFMPALTAEWPTWPLPNVHLGVSCEDQKRADERIPDLLETPAAVRFVSAEPLIGEIDLFAFLKTELRDRSLAILQRRAVTKTPGLDWLIVGGESGTGARVFEIPWGESLVKQCREAGVPVFFKQVGAKPVHSAEPTGNFRDGPNGKRQFELTIEPLRISDRKGGNPLDWPESLRVRQFPEARS